MSMRKGHSLLGLAVIAQNGGENLGKVLDLVFDHDADQCVALVVKERDLFGLIPAQVVPWEEVLTIGPDAVMVREGKSRIGAGDNPRIRSVMERDHALAGTRIYTEDGRDLGTFADVYLEPESGRVLGYEISGGFVSDTMSGKRFLPAELGPDIGKDAVIVPAHTAQLLEEQAQTEPGGLKGATQTAGEKIGETYDAAKEKAGETYDAAKEKAGETYAGIAGSSVEKQQEFVIGKVAANDVTIPRRQPVLGAVPGTMPAAVLVAQPSAQPSQTIMIPRPDSTAPTPSTAIVDAPVMSGPPSGEQDETTLHLPPLGAGISGEPSGTSAPVAQPVDASVTGSEIVPVVTAENALAVAPENVVSDEILVRKGETITRQHAILATEAGVLGKLVAAAAGGMAGGTYDAARERVTGVADTAGQHAENYGDSLQAKAENAAIGKPAGTEVTLPNGATLIAPGQLITRAVMDEAKLHGKEKAVIAAAGLGAASESVQSGVETVKAGAGNLWDTVKQKTAELTGAAHEKKAEMDEAAQQQKINNALGRPTTRVILAPDDSVILNTGDIITHAAVNRAREQGVLDILLDSVFTTNPEITPEMLRVEGKGEAALEGQQKPTGGPITATVNPGEPAQDEPAQGLPTYDGKPPLM